MEKQIPSNITNEKDLKYFEEYLAEAKGNLPHLSRTSSPIKALNPQAENSKSFYASLKEHIGKLVKIEFLVGNAKEIKVGTLFSVGKDFIVLKPFQNSATVICDIKAIKFITVIHDNDRKKLIRK